MREKAITFGRENTLVGILTELKTKKDYGDKPGIIILNSGILHRVGPCRLSVKLARSFAEQGYPVIRFDASGIGDSDVRKDALTFEESGPLEVQDCMDYMTKTKKVDQFILMGLCSGADLSFMTACVDQRVIATMQIDAYAYITPRYKTKQLMERLSRLPRLLVWENLKHSIQVRLPAPEDDQTAQDDENLAIPTYSRVFPPKEDVHTKLKMLAERGLYFYYLYTGDEDLYNYQEQFQDAFSDINFNQRLTVDYFEEADHIIRDLSVQTKVVKTLTQWVTSNWGQGEVPVDKAAA